MAGPGEFVGVIRLVNCFAAVHVTNEHKKFISKHLELELRVAQAAAESFAATHNIHYDGDLKDLDKPLITVVKHMESWFPAELHPDGISMLEYLGKANLGSPEQESAINLANAIALSRGGDCLPEIGISLGAL